MREVGVGGSSGRARFRPGEGATVLVAAGFDADAFLRGRALATMKAF